jgi:AraC family transcriptional regulator
MLKEAAKGDCGAVDVKARPSSYRRAPGALKWIAQRAHDSGPINRAVPESKVLFKSDVMQRSVPGPTGQNLVEKRQMRQPRDVGIFDKLIFPLVEFDVPRTCVEDGQLAKRTATANGGVEMFESTHRWQDGSGKRTDQLDLYQGDGNAPEILLSAKWPGEKGLRVSHYRFKKGAYISVVPVDHMVVFQPHSVPYIACRVGDEQLNHSAPAWNVTVSPSNAECRAESSGGLEVLVLTVPTQSLAFAVVDQASPGSNIVSRLNGRDDVLARLGRAIAAEAAAGFPEGPLGWDRLTDSFVERLATSHMSYPVNWRRGLLDKCALRRVRDFVAANIDQPLTISAIAAAAGQDPSHFARIFARTVRMTPHRYVVQARLAHALQLIRMKRLSFAEAASGAGFADQSHLSNWARRVHGATLKELTRRPS